MDPSNEPGSPGLGSQQSYPPRVCRICLETVLPTFQPSEFLHKARVVYESEDPESGRLLRPCKCKGSSRYVHEGCLQTWRHADPRYGARNYWECPTCHFQYRLERLTWARWISSAVSQITLTLAILLMTIFILGFVADPIIDLALGPVVDDMYLELEEDASWPEHFVKGFVALGFASFFKAIFTLSPFHWNFRGSGVVNSGRSTGRNRLGNLTWVMIIFGIGTFLWVCLLLERATTPTNPSRLYTRAFDRGVRGLSKARASESWTSLYPMTAMRLFPNPQIQLKRYTLRPNEITYRTTLSCRAPANDTSISQCAKNYLSFLTLFGCLRGMFRRVQERLVPHPRTASSIRCHLGEGIAAPRLLQKRSIFFSVTHFGLRSGTFQVIYLVSVSSASIKHSQGLYVTLQLLK